MDDDHEADVDLGLAVSAALSANFAVQLAVCAECAVSCAAGVGIGGFSRRLRSGFDSPWY